MIDTKNQTQAPAPPTAVSYQSSAVSGAVKGTNNIPAINGPAGKWNKQEDEKKSIIGNNPLEDDLDNLLQPNNKVGPKPNAE